MINTILFQKLPTWKPNYIKHARQEAIAKAKKEETKNHRTTPFHKYAHVFRKLTLLWSPSKWIGVGGGGVTTNKQLEQGGSLEMKITRIKTISRISGCLQPTEAEIALPSRWSDAVAGWIARCWVNAAIIYRPSFQTANQPEHPAYRHKLITKLRVPTFYESY